MRYLVGIPCLYGAGHTKEAIESVVNHADVSVLLIDNGAEEEVVKVINYYSTMDNVYVIHNKENIYVNPAWNQIIAFFLKNDYDYLLIMNSDLILHAQWKVVLNEHFKEQENDIPVPFISNDKMLLELSYPNPMKQLVTEGTPGVLIILDHLQATHIFPIPDKIKVWFGDNWIYEGLRKLGYKTFVLYNLMTYHSGSQNVSRVKGISEIIEQDKLEWEKLK